MNRGPSIEELPNPKVQVVSPAPLRPINPSNLSLLDRARNKLENPNSTVASLLTFNKDTLRTLCHEKGVPYPGRSQKLDLVEKLFVAVSYVAWKHFGTSDWSSSLVDLSKVPVTTSMRGAWWT